MVNSNMLERLAEVMAQRKAIEAQIEPLAREESELRIQILEQLTENGINGIKSAWDSGKQISATVVTRRDMKVADEATVRTFLQTNGLLEECLRLDLPTVKRFAKSREIPGMEEVESTSLTVKESAPKVEVVAPNESLQNFHARMRGEA